MKIGIDARVLDREMTGTGRYLMNLLMELPYHDNINKYYLFTSSELPVDKTFYKIVKQKTSCLPQKIYSPIWLNLLLPKLLKNNGIDLLFSPNILIPMVGLNKIKCVSVVHDVIPKVDEQFYSRLYRMYLSYLLPRSLKRSDKILTVSTHSRNDIIKYFNTPISKLGVVSNTASSNFKQRDLESEENFRAIEFLNLPDKYLLYVGVIGKRKNIMGLLRILDFIKANGSDLKLVLVGKPDYDSETLLPEISKRGENVIHFQFLEDRILSLVYNYAFAFVFPSFYEGFGIPPLEAMQSGIPVLASNRSALTEVVGEGGILIDPDDYEGFAKEIKKLEDDYNYYSKMKTRALEQAGKFRIEDTTKKLVNYFNSLK